MITFEQRREAQQALAIRHTLNELWTLAAIEHHERLRAAYMAAMMSDWHSVAQILDACVKAEGITHWSNHAYNLVRELRLKIADDPVAPDPVRMGAALAADYAELELRMYAQVAGKQ